MKENLIIKWTFKTWCKKCKAYDKRKRKCLLPVCYYEDTEKNKRAV